MAQREHHPAERIRRVLPPARSHIVEDSAFATTMAVLGRRAISNLKYVCLPVRVFVKNVGLSPATHVYAQSRLVVAEVGTEPDIVPKRAHTEATEACSDARTIGAQFGLAIFPGERQRITPDNAIQAETVDKPR